MWGQGLPMAYYASSWKIWGHSNGVNLTMFHIGAIDEGNYYTKFLLKNKEDGFTWARYAVYGPPQQQHKASFLAELAYVCSKKTHPMLIGGDFNILR